MTKTQTQIEWRVRAQKLEEENGVLKEQIIMLQDKLSQMSIPGISDMESSALISALNSEKSNLIRTINILTNEVVTIRGELENGADRAEYREQEPSGAI